MAKFNSKSTLVYLGAYDVTALSTMLDVQAKRVINDVTGFGGTGRGHLAMVQESQVEYEGIFDDIAGNLDNAMAALRVAAATTPASFYPGGAAIGLKGFAGSVYLTNEPVQIKVPEAILLKASFLFDGTSEQKVTSLGVKATVTATTAGATQDDAAQSTIGGSWYYHVTAVTASGGNAQWQVEWQDSANGSVWATIGTEKYNVTGAGGPVGARHDLAAGATVRRYVRLNLTLDASSGSITVQAGYVRGALV